MQNTNRPDGSAAESSRGVGVDNLFKLAVDAAPIGVLLSGPDGTIRLVNRSLEQQFGYAQHELLGQRVEMLLPDSLQSDHRSHRLRYVEHPENRRMGVRRELFGRHKDGSRIPVEIDLNAVDTEEGLFVLAFVADVTERRRSDDAHRRDLTERLAFERLVGDLSATFVNLSADRVDQTIRDAQRRICETLDLDRSTLFQLSETNDDFILTHNWGRGDPAPPPPLGLSRSFPWSFAKILAGETASFSSPDEVPDPIERESLRTFETRSRAAIPISIAGRIVAAISFASVARPRQWSPETLARLQLLAQVFAGALARKQADLVLQASEERFRTLADTAPVMIWMSGRDQLCTWFNRQWLEFVGHDMAHELGTGWTLGVHPDDLESCLNVYVAAFDARRPFTMEYRLRRHDGEWRWIRDNGTPNYAADGTFVGYLGSCLDVTDLKEVTLKLERAYEELRDTQQGVIKQERLHVLGQMASGIAHDINNSLSPVSLYTESILEDEAGLSAEAREYLRTIQRAVDDVGETLNRLRQFSRQHEPTLALEPLNLNELAEDVQRLTRARWSDMTLLRGTVITMHLDLAADVPAFMGVESEIRGALTNLVFNAVDAMPLGGTLTIRTRSGTRAGADGGMTPTAQIEVADTGVGMSSDTRQRCLEPFFTTKGEGGTGLGLAMVYGVVQRHNAEIGIDSTLDVGTTVRLIFPARSQPLVDGDRTTESDSVPSRLHILVIDDNPVFAKSLSDILERDGQAVSTAPGGREGIESFHDAASRGAPFDIVITDLGMPHIDGRKVAAAVKAASPSTPVILLTGWGRRLLEEDDVPHVDRVLSKPPKLQELRAALAWAASLGKVPGPTA